MWPRHAAAYAGDEYVVKIRDKEIRTALTTTSLSGTKVRKVALPRTRTTARSCAGCCARTCPGSFPFTAGVFAFKRENEDPTRMFAGEGDAFRTNRRFQLLSAGMPAKRLSTAFDSVTLYGDDPTAARHLRQGRQLRRVDRHARRHEGAVLRLRPVRADDSVSMTINGPAPTILAMFMNTAIDQQVDKVQQIDNGREPTDDERRPRPRAARRHRRRSANGRWRTVRGTVQADILKEDQGQNTCIFSPSSRSR
jgi:methylmalonyl-CoA mutase